MHTHIRMNVHSSINNGARDEYIFIHSDILPSSTLNIHTPGMPTLVV